MSMSEIVQIIQVLGILGWFIVIAGSIFTLIFIIIFVWFASKLFKESDDFDTRRFEKRFDDFNEEFNKYFKH